MVGRPLIRAIALALLWALPASATQDAWPALFDVAGVAPDDRLNIRSEPGAAGDIIGSFAHDATNIEVLMPNERQTWGLVNFGEGTGWVSLSYLQRQSGQWMGAFPQVTACYGTEPFWSLTRQGGNVVFSRPDAAEDPVPLDWETGSLAHRGRHAFRAGDMVGVIATGQCTDGMSDRQFGLELNLIRLGEDQLLTGCCTLQP